MSRGRAKTQQLILNAVTGNGAGTPMRVVGFESIILQVGSINSGACTIKVQGSLSGQEAYDTAPDFDAARTVSNHWDYIGSWDLNTGTGVLGDTGYTFAGVDTDNIMNILVNTEGLEWVNVEVSGYAAGDITVRGFGFSFS